jgi:2-phosphosulfolactate phosphatase
MRTIDVCLSPDLMHLYSVENQIVVVVDIFRATSCMTTAFAHGIARIKPFAKMEDCLAMKAHGYFTAGERDGKKVEGFDFGNSPFEYMDPSLKGQRIAFTTTNGTQAIAKSEGAAQIVIGSFLNIEAVANYLRKFDHNILIVCAGWKGKFNLEDTVFAGALIDLLQDVTVKGCDSPIAAHALYHVAKNDLVGYLQQASHTKRLAKLNIVKDIAFCLTPNQYPIVPALVEGELQLV